jgi:hypothetical protein
MNRLDMAKIIAERVPILAQRDGDEWREAEQLRADFVADFPLQRIPELTLDEYVIGKGAGNRSFCYRLEREMDLLGKIVGATAFKFGVYFGRTKSDAVAKYRFASHWGSTAGDAFSSVKAAIVQLLQAAAVGDMVAIAKNSLSPMLKGKILFVYYPEQFAPIYSEEHLTHFITELDLSGSLVSGPDMQRALMVYRATWPELAGHSPAFYMYLLYDIFGYPPKGNLAETASVNVPLLDQAIKGAQFITEMPPLPVALGLKPKLPAKPDYEKQARSFKRIGDRGEALVVALERARLIQAGKPELAARLKHVSQEDDNAGYDILSFDEDGSRRPIEVKATTGKNLDRGFYISHNEVEQAKALPNFHIYFVFSAMSPHPRVLPRKNPKFDETGFLLRPIAYHATLAAPATV